MAVSGWEELKDLFISNGLGGLADELTSLIKDYGKENTSLVYSNLRKSAPYKLRFAGNEELVKQGKNPLTEADYISTEKAYDEVLASFGAKDFNTQENKNKWIGGTVSGYELSQRFTAAYDRVTTAVSGQDKDLLASLKEMYPGVTDTELTKTLLLGAEGSEYLKTRMTLADVKAAEKTVGLPSVLGAGFLASQKINRTEATVGLSKVADQIEGLKAAAFRYGEDISATELQTELEQENLLGKQAGVKTKKLASQARAEFGGQSGITTGSLGKKRSGSL